MPQKKIQDTQIESIQASQLTGILSTTQGGTGSSDSTVSRSNLGAAKSGANSDITSLTGLTTAITIPQGGTGKTNKTDAFNELSPLSTKGDIISYDGTNNVRIPAGINGQVLMADSTATAGLKWAPGAVGTVTSISASGGSTGLTVTGGPITSSGTFTLGGKLELGSGGTGLTSVPGSNGQLIFNSTGNYSATSLMNYSGTTLTLGSSEGTFTFAGAGPASNASSGANIIIVGGQSGHTGVVGGEPGSIFIRGGPGASNAGAGGNVYLQAGSGPFRSGSVFISTGQTLTERLRIISTGAWGLSGANYGTTGQVLTSNGSNASPTWTTPGTPSNEDIISALGYTPVNKAGDTMTGALTLSGAPTSDLHAATKQYVDSVAGTGGFTGGTVANATTFSSAVTLSSSLTFGTSYTESTSNITAAATTNIDCSLSNNFIISMGANITSLTFSNVPASGRLYYIALVIRQDATGGRTLAWPATIKWPGGVSPVITSTANKYDIITIMTFDGGTSWSGFVAGQNY